ncbi:MAG: hypothetical protein RDU20_22940 [Desulfomonilaceae bacterium]|nr:hypothetical protein [Desulfomonilaceae bacterium]
MSSNTTLHDEDKREALLELRNRVRADAIEKLRESGLILVAQASM